jgi:MFS family permease
MKSKNGNSTFIFYLVTATYWFSLYSYGSVLSNYSASLGADVTMVGLISGSYGFAQMILRLPVGVFSDVIRKRKIFIGIGLLFSIASGIGLGLASTPIQMLVFRSLAGVSVSTFIVFPGYMTETYTHLDNHRAMGNMTASSRIGRTVAILAGGLVAQILGGSWAFLIGGIAAAVCLMPYLLLPGDTYGDGHKKHSVRELLNVIRDRHLFISAITAVFFQFGTFAAIYTFTPMLAKDIGISEAGIGLLTAFFTLTGSFSSILAGSYFKREFGTVKTVAAAFLVSGVIFWLMPRGGGVITLFALQFAAGFSMGVILPLLMARSMNNVPVEKKGTAMGYFQSIYGIGIISGPYLVGLVINNGNIEDGYTVIAGVCIAAAAFTLLTGRETVKNGLEKHKKRI